MAKPFQIIEFDERDELPLRFRMTMQPIRDNPKNINLNGFAELNISGSGQFTEGGLAEMRKRFGKVHCIIIDLRQESHGFFNGKAVSWFGIHNEANQGLTGEQVEQDQKEKLNFLANATSVRFDQLEGKSVDWDGELNPIKVSSEKELVTSQGFQYVRFYVTDHHRPDDDVVDLFIAFVNALTENPLLHFHCRLGIGRTTTFMLMFDMMRNAKDVSFDDILGRHILIGGRNMYEMDPVNEPYKYNSAVNRLDFIRQFYAYCAENQDRFKTVWSEWIEQLEATPFTKMELQ
ncbi:fused DSP-PTPase phosphatase/NAD kinase-like protein [Cohnella silvisoli]|uniref:Tyrosine specific protein phosphatases domain-containing protein n=1 Tax=Cohnella silvisoli TaxID=2873699 RepID=A0ABV1KQK5_9BACL|nr:hypothetical protein [Cohnella silvisoli]MCD9022039.1 hypothetical protein [Cohnella silvisoli]